LGRGRNLSDGLNRRPTWCRTGRHRSNRYLPLVVCARLYYCRPTHDRTNSLSMDSRSDRGSV
jgi:hypothetical protein